MKLISHRGNIKEPIPNRENSPSYIDTAISAGYEVEVDIRYVENKFYLGHDNPDYEVSKKWLEMRRDKIWFHCKDLNSANKLQNMGNFMFFCHNSDPYILTSNGYIWVHDLKLNLDNKCIIPLLSDKDIQNYYGNIVHAICTDYISLAEYNLKEKGLYK